MICCHSIKFITGMRRIQVTSNIDIYPNHTRSSPLRINIILKSFNVILLRTAKYTFSNVVLPLRLYPNTNPFLTLTLPRSTLLNPIASEIVRSPRF